MNNIKVSVIIPVYNTEKYLNESINSILLQTLPEIEIIIINDGSTDNSAEILARFAQQDNRVRILTHKINKGLSEARNTGIKAVQGQYLYFFDSDDILELDCLELCYEKSGAENLDFLFFDAITFYDDIDNNNLKLNYQRTNGLEPKIYSGIEILEILLKKKAYKDSVCLSFIKTSYLRNLNLTFYPHLLHEDILFTIQLYAKANRVNFINRSFFHRRMRGNSIIGKITVKNIDDILFSAKEILKFRENLKLSDKRVINMRMKNLCLFLAKKLLSFDGKIFLSKFSEVAVMFLRSL